METIVNNNINDNKNVNIMNKNDVNEKGINNNMKITDNEENINNEINPTKKINANRKINQKNYKRKFRKSSKINHIITSSNDLIIPEMAKEKIEAKEEKKKQLN